MNDEQANNIIKEVAERLSDDGTLVGEEIDGIELTGVGEIGILLSDGTEFILTVSEV